MLSPSLLKDSRSREGAAFSCSPGTLGVLFSPSLSGEAAGLGTTPTHPLPRASSPPPCRGKLGPGSVWTNPRLQFAGEKNSCPISKRWGLQNSVGEGRKTPEEGQRAGTGTGRDWDTQRREMRDTGNRRVRARNLEPTETLGRPETEVP